MQKSLVYYERVGATVDNCCLLTKHDFNFRFNLSIGLPISYVAFDNAIKPSDYKAMSLSFFPRDLTLLLFKCKSKSSFNVCCGSIGERRMFPSVILKCAKDSFTRSVGLIAAEFKFFNESDAPYTCNDCFAIEIGNSPYNYKYALTRLRQVNIINIIKLCRQSTRLFPLYSA